MRSPACAHDAGMSQPPFHCKTLSPRKRLPMQDADATPPLAARPGSLPPTSTVSTPDTPATDARPLAVLFIEDSVSDFALMQATLRRAGILFQPRRVETEQEMRDALAAQSWDAIISDYSLPTFNAESALQLAQHHNADVPFLIVSGEIGEGAAVEAMLAGADDYIMKNNLRRLPPALKRSLRAAQTRRQRLHAEEQLRELSRHADRLREQERAELAREIHDDLGQNLLVLRIDADMLASRTQQRHPRLHARARATLGQIDATIKSVRQIINDLRPTVLDLGVNAAVEWQAAQFRARTGIACEVSESHGDISVSDQCATALFRILQESLSNISQHANASRVRIRLEKDHGNVSLTVSDNGVGAGADGRNKHGSFGLVGIEERIKLLGGTFLIDSSPGAGMSVQVTVPLAAGMQDFSHQ